MGFRRQTHQKSRGLRIVEIILNGEPRQVADGLSIAQLLELFGWADKYVAVEVNRQVIPRARHREHYLAPGDQVEVVTLVGGG